MREVASDRREMALGRCRHWISRLQGGRSMCTSLRITAGDGTVLVGRTMEYSLDVNWELRAVPRRVAQASSAPDGDGLSWSGSYGYVGMGSGETAALGATIPRQPSVPDGVNEAGLYAG